MFINNAGARTRNDQRMGIEEMSTAERTDMVEKQRTGTIIGTGTEVRKCPFTLSDNESESEICEIVAQKLTETNYLRLCFCNRIV